MGGGDGVVISRDAAASILSNPIVLGLVPVTIRGALDSVLKKPTDQWTDADCDVVTNALNFALKGRAAK